MGGGAVQDLEDEQVFGRQRWEVKTEETIQVKETVKKKATGRETRGGVSKIWQEGLRDTGDQAGETGQDLVEKGSGRLRIFVALPSYSMVN